MVSRSKPSRSYFRPRDGEALVQRWRESGLSMAAFCREEDVSRRRLTYWRDKLEASGFVELVVGEPGSALQMLEPADAAGASSAEDAVELVIGDAFLRFPDRPGLAAELVGALLARSS